MANDTRHIELLKHLKREKLPNHVAVIMAGNGRWAKQRGRPRVFGHRTGADSVRAMVQLADQLGIKVLTLFAFSEENWGRPDHEIRAIMLLFNTYLVKEREELRRRNVQLKAIGRLDRLPAKTLELLRETQDYLADNSGLVLNIALSYGGRSEIIDACQNVARRVQAGELAPQDINHEIICASLTTWDLPDPDLLIRTSGEQRLSNFLLWQMAYTELYFTPTHWPDFRETEFALALGEYQRRQRRFGLVTDGDDEAPLSALSTPAGAGAEPRDFND
jgi:undecaprenyl diphosphate synthase